ncbi:hypothetical protein [Stenotrophomonas acidaminiphila]|uniref:hypothetical protein n=1 Tax=Stenotrophomonas acidaminiphila TaxID=128780 RepID=UPI00289A3903|nr:hypothetical protein [Stenotrophomonas acidaminiphila]
MRRSAATITVLLLALASTNPVFAGKKNAPLPDDPTQDALMISAGFLNGHPDLRFRLLALEKRQAGKLDDAFKFFQRAAYYADKPSQGMVAEMLWNGTGTTQDKAAAYAWMDMAAERGYGGFLELRERYWAALDEAQRERAITLGQDIYARYGDEAALPRIANEIRKERKAVTGSRTGFAGNVKIYVPGPAGSMEEIDATKFYDDRYWDPKQYQAWHDAIWMKPRVARVDVGGVEQVPVAPDKRSRIPQVAPQVDAPEPVTEDAMPKLNEGAGKR